MSASGVEVTALDGVAHCPAQDWDACAAPIPADAALPDDPFVTHAFLTALEHSGSVGPGTGWQPTPLIARQKGQIIGVAPLYAKSHSQGEYIFDHSWAHAYEQAGGAYYPKLQIAAPFSPVTGRRLLARPGHEAIAQAALVQGAIQLAAEHELSGLHITFCTAEEARAGQAMGLLPRISQQYHWANPGYGNFDEFLADLSSRKRKTIRKERRVAQTFGGRIVQLRGDDLRPEHWDAMWQFYQDTGQRKWGSPYLTRSFFDLLHQTMRPQVLMVLALDGDRPIAGALNLIGRERLYGRYWGCTEHHPCLHFELCYYQAIDFAIRHGLKSVEAGAQGDHKLARGYLPVPCHSVHWLAHPGLSDAVAHFLEAEREAVGEEIEVLTGYGPFRAISVQEQD